MGLPATRVFTILTIMDISCPRALIEAAASISGKTTAPERSLHGTAREEVEMLETKRDGQDRSTICPHGQVRATSETVAPTPLAISDLPPPNTKRWVVRRKAAVVTAVRSGAMTADEACRRYGLSEEELLAWQQAFASHGLPGLRATRLPTNRSRRSARTKP
jgi:hypothetical protein